MKTFDLFQYKYLIAFGTEGLETLIKIEKNTSLLGWNLRKRLNSHRNIKDVYVISTYDDYELFKKLYHVYALNDLIRITIEDENISILKLDGEIEH